MKERQWEHRGRALLTLNENNKHYPIEVRVSTEKGYIEMIDSGICDLCFPNSKSRRGRVQYNGTICPSITSSGMMLCIVSVIDE